MFKYFFIVLILVSQSVLALSSREIRKVNPPNLADNHLGEKVLCYRPMRQGSPNLSVEKLDNKVIIHNYGHGGAGWTLAPGSANYVNNLLINSEYSKDLQKDSPITVIGAGVIGLFTTYDLIQKGYTNITIVAENFTSLTSENAGGLISPASLDNDPEGQKLIDTIGIESYKFYNAIIQKQNPNLQNGARKLPIYYEQRSSTIEMFVGKVMQPAKEVVLDFGNGTKRDMVAYDDSIFVDVSIMMDNLTRYLKSKNVKFVQKRVNSFSEIKDKFIFNCTGYGAKTLNGDNKLTSVQGHMIMLKNQTPKDLDYMIFADLDSDKTQTGKDIHRFFFFAPKHNPQTGVNDVGVLVGSFVKDATSSTPHMEEFDVLLKNARTFYGIK